MANARKRFVAKMKLARKQIAKTARKWTAQVVRIARKINSAKRLALQTRKVHVPKRQNAPKWLAIKSLHAQKQKLSVRRQNARSRLHARKPMLKNAKLLNAKKLKNARNNFSLTRYNKSGWSTIRFYCI